MTALEDRTNPTANVSVTALSSSMTEGGSTASFRVATDDTSNTIFVLFTLSGTATSGSDYSTTHSSMIMLEQGDASEDITITPFDDMWSEGTESVVLTISSSPLIYNIGSPGSASMSLFDTDNPQVTVAKQGSDPTEGGNGTFRITRTGSTSGNLTVNFTTGGTATSGTDYTSIGTSATITSGNSYVDVTVATLADNAVEGAETATITITDGGSAYSAYGSGATASMTIADDPPVISIARLADGEEGGSDGTFRVSRTGGDISEAMVVTYTIGGTAVGDDDEDYVELSGTVTIASSNAYADITIDVTNDSDDESSETVILTLDSSEDYLVRSSSDTLFIWDNDLSSFHWTGADNDNWMNPDNWAESDVPGAEDAVYFTGSYTNDARLYGPLSPYSVRELRVASGYTGTITLSFPLSVGSLKMEGGTIDQPYSGYGSDLTITETALWTGGVLNSTGNLANVTFDGATVAVDNSNDLETGSDLQFANAAGAIAPAVAPPGKITFNNGTGAIISGSSYFTIGINGIGAGSVGGDVKVDGGIVSIAGGTTLNSLYVLHGGTAIIAGGGTVSFTGLVPGSGTTSVDISGGVINIQNGSTLDGGKNYVDVAGWTGSSSYSAELNTFASSFKSQTTATITASKLLIGTSGGGGAVTVTIEKDDLAPGDHVISDLAVLCPIDWKAGIYKPTVSASNGTRDRWTTNGEFKIDGSTTSVQPISQAGVSVNNAYAVLEAAGKFKDWNGDNLNGVKPGLPLTNGKSETMWAWKNDATWDQSLSWYIKSTAV